MYEVRPGVYEVHCARSIRTLFGYFIKLCTSALRKSQRNHIFAIAEKKMKGYLIISKGAELLRVPLKNLVYIQASGNYSEVVTMNGKKTLVSYQLGQIEDMIEEQLGDDSVAYLRLGRGLIINNAFIFHIDATKQKLVLSDGDRFWEELSASKEVLTKLKAWIEAESNTESND